MLEKAWDALNRKIENPSGPPPPEPSSKPQNAESDVVMSENKTEEKTKDKEYSKPKETHDNENEETFDDAQLPDGLSVDDLDLVKQIQSNKDTTVRLSNSELQGKTREEKLKILDEKRNQFRQEKASAVVTHDISRERQRREGVKSAQDAQRKREEYQRRMVVERKKREDTDAKKRKDAIRAKIKEDQERRKQQNKKLNQSQPKQE